MTPLNDTQLAGQRLMIGFDGTALDADLRYAIGTLKVGGLILFARNLETPEQIAALCRDAQRCAAAHGQPPLFIAIDQEGGVVARLKPPFTCFDGNPAMRGRTDAERFARITARELSGVGINMNLAPVLDVAAADSDSVMARRTFGGDPTWVADMGRTVIEGLQRAGIMAVAKHFPGIGRTVLDSHEDLPNVDLSPEDLAAIELPPFAAAVAEGVAGVMLSHVRYTQLDPHWPASLSTVVAKDLLRTRMGYTGLVLTDDLDMGAVVRHFDIPTAAARVVAADIDLALICHAGPAIVTAFETLLAGLRGNADLKARARASAERILAVKRRYLRSDPSSAPV